MVPNSFLARSPPSGPHDFHIGKEKPSRLSRVNKKTPILDRPATRPRASSPVSNPTPKGISSPVQIPQSCQKHRASSSSFSSTPQLSSLPQSRARNIDTGKGTQSPASAAPLKSLLSATTIPRRKKKQGRQSQKLPGGDHVAEFSKLLLDDVAHTHSRMAFGSLGNPQFEELFGPLVDKTGTGRSEPESLHAVTPFSVRSTSSESMPSLVVDDDFGERSCPDSSSASPSAQKSPPDRPPRLLSPSEDCGDDHPLLHLNMLDPLLPIHDDILVLPTPPKSPPSQKSRKSSLRSNLTSSLRALKTAAQTVSSLATSPPRTIPDDFLTRSIFSFAPELTDDKRPPPSTDPPSAALRRYLNPHSTRLDSKSPAELHPYNEYPSRHRDTNKRGGKCSSPPRPSKSIQLQICIPSAVRSANATSPPIWLTPDGTPTTHHPALPSVAAPHQARQREPRENGAFLRILVAEMNMRRSGKFDETMDSHACVWLPPRKTVDGQTQRSGSERWTVYIAG